MTILVTGAGGLLGGAVAAELAARGRRVLGLVRRPAPILAHDGGPAGARAQPVSGDVRLPGLGLDATALRDVAAIVHCAALTGFAEPADNYRAVNIDGAVNALALGAQLGVPVVQVSTAYVCGARSGPVFERDLPDSRFANGYEASKAAAERAARLAMAAGQRVVVARPSIIVGAWEDGAIRRFGDVYLLVRMFALGRLSTMPVAADASLDFVAIDRVARGIAYIAERARDFAGRTLHLTSGAPVTPTDLAAEAAVRGFPVPRFVDAADFSPRALPGAEARLHRGLAALYATYLARAPAFDRTAAAAVPGFERPAGGPGHLGRVIGHAIAAGFLPDGTAPRPRHAPAVRAMA
jgi:nucleoside-diphosphate-sugar epimerase